MSESDALEHYKSKYKLYKKKYKDIKKSSPQYKANNNSGDADQDPKQLLAKIEEVKKSYSDYKKSQKGEAEETKEKIAQMQ